MKLPLWWPSIELGLALSLLIPLTAMVIVLPIKKYQKIIKWMLLGACVFMILHLTVFRGSYKNTEEHMINLRPFWSYSHLSEADYQWQIFMNIFLFIPFGCLLPWTTDKTFIRTILIGCIFSILIEVIQYIFMLGMCEFDDVLHNTLGMLVGYGYFKLLQIISKKLLGFFQKQ